MPSRTASRAGCQTASGFYCLLVDEDRQKEEPGHPKTQGRNIPCIETRRDRQAGHDAPSGPDGNRHQTASGSLEAHPDLVVGRGAGFAPLTVTRQTWF